MKNQQAAEEIIRRHADMVYRIALSYTRNTADADDVFQETFLRYVRRRPQFDSEAHEKAWLIRVCVNCAKTCLASPWRRHTQPLTGCEMTAYSDDHALSEALDTLSPEDRAVIHLYYFEGYQTDEIAEILHKKPSTIRSRLTRARKRLELILKEDAQ